MGERQNVEEEWGEMGEINNSQKANQTDQLEAWRFKMTAKNHNLPKAKSEQVPEDAIQGMRIEIPKEETQNKYGMLREKLKLWKLGKMVLSYEYHYQRFQKGILREKKTSVIKSKENR